MSRVVGNVPLPPGIPPGRDCPHDITKQPHSLERRRCHPRRAAYRSSPVAPPARHAGGPDQLDVGTDALRPVPWLCPHPVRTDRDTCAAAARGGSPRGRRVLRGVSGSRPGAHGRSRPHLQFAPAAPGRVASQRSRLAAWAVGADSELGRFQRRAYPARHRHVSRPRPAADARGSAGRWRPHPRVRTTPGQPGGVDWLRAVRERHVLDWLRTRGDADADATLVRRPSRQAEVALG